jgi:hypothetical protein
MDAETATYWLGWLRLVQLIAVFLVAVGVVAEFAGEWIGRPLEKIIDDSREKQIEELKHDTAAADARAAEAQQKANEADVARLKLEEKTPQDGYPSMKSMG